MERSRYRLAFLSCAVAALLAAGCGGASHRPTSATPALATTASGTGTVAAVSRVGGQKRSAAHGSSVTGRTVVEKPAPPVPPRRFAYLANALCNSAAGGAGGVLPSSGRVQSLAAAVRAAALAAGLRRLATATGRLDSVTPLLNADQSLALAARAAHGKNNAAVQAAERQVAAAAQSIDAQSCAPQGR